MRDDRSRRGPTSSPRRGRAAARKPASSHAGPPASATSASMAAAWASSSTARTPPCGAPASASWRVVQPVQHAAQRRGDRQEQQPAGARAHRRGLRPRRLEHPHAGGRALVDERRVGAHAPPCPAARSSRGSVPTSSRQPAALELRVRGRQLARAGAGATAARSASRSCPPRATRPSLVLDRERHPQVRRAAGATSHAVARDAHAAHAPRARAPSASSSGSRARLASARGPRRRRPGTGTSGLRSSFGSTRISVVTSSGRSAGDQPVEPDGRSSPSAVSGTCTVTPSSRRPARSGRRAAATRSPCFHAAGRARGSSTSAAAGSTSSSRV